MLTYSVKDDLMFAIRYGYIRQIIRPLKPNSRLIKIGEKIKIKSAGFYGAFQARCTFSHPILITNSEMYFGDALFFKNGSSLFLPAMKADKRFEKNIAEGEGLQSPDNLRKEFKARHSLPFLGQLILWHEKPEQCYMSTFYQDIIDLYKFDKEMAFKGDMQ